MDLSRERRLADMIGSVTNRLGLTDAYGSLRRRLAGSQAVVITYHRVGDPNEFPWNLPIVSTRAFESQMRYLKRSFEILSADTLVTRLEQGKYLPPRAVVITFDDGYRNNFTHAYPVLRKYDIPALINLTTAYIGTGNVFWWDRIKYSLWETKLDEINLGELGEFNLSSVNERVRAAFAINNKLKARPNNERNLLIDNTVYASGVNIPADLGHQLILSWDEIKEMSRNGISFGAHSRTHPILMKLSPEEARQEIAQSKKDIEDKLGIEVTGFCYPNGDFDSKIVDIVKGAGFRYGLTAVPEMINNESRLHELGRVSAGWNVNTLKLFMSGAYADMYTIRHGLSRK